MKLGSLFDGIGGFPLVATWFGVEPVTSRMGTGGGNVPLILNLNGGDLCGTLDANYYRGPGARSGKEREMIYDMQGVRKLTPRECERLQGFPSDWTRWGADNKEISDTQRYKACGNSVALPCVEFVLGQITKELSK